MVGRPRTITDDQILGGAVAVLSRLGPQGLTLAAVADEVGLRGPTLIQRFGCKRDLLLALSARGGKQVPLLFAAARRQHCSPLAAVVSALRSLVAEIDSKAAMGHHLAFLAMDLTDPDLGRLAAAHAQALLGEIEACLSLALAVGELAALPKAGGRAVGLARTVYTAYNGSLIAWAVDGQGPLGDWISHDIGAVLAPFRKGASGDA